MQSSHDRRLFPRISVTDVLVNSTSQLDPEENAIQGTIEDLSLGGLQMSYGLYDELSDVVYLWFIIPTGASFAGIQARVVWSAFDGSRQKAGLEFLRLEPINRNTLEQFITEFEQRPGN